MGWPTTSAPAMHLMYIVFFSQPISSTHLTVFRRRGDASLRRNKRKQSAQRARGMSDCDAPGKMRVIRRVVRAADFVEGLAFASSVFVQKNLFNAAI
jgi:hypothetical protein